MSDAEIVLENEKLKEKVKVLGNTVSRLRRAERSLKTKVRKLEGQLAEKEKKKKDKFRNKRSGYHGY